MSSIGSPEMMPTPAWMVPNANSLDTTHGARACATLLTIGPSNDKTSRRRVSVIVERRPEAERVLFVDAASSKLGG
jgi:hypothetical protein